MMKEKFINKSKVYCRLILVKKNKILLLLKRIGEAEIVSTKQLSPIATKK